jgi:hypothetical protein
VNKKLLSPRCIDASLRSENQNAYFNEFNFKNEFTNFNFNTQRPFGTGEAEEIILPTETGEMGVLKNLLLQV